MDLGYWYYMLLLSWTRRNKQNIYRPDISCYTIALLFCPPFYIHRKTHLICPWHNVHGAQRERICCRSIMAKPSLNCNIGISRSALFLHSATSLPFSPALPPLYPTRSHPVIEISLLGVLTWSTASALITASCRTTLALHDLAACYANVCLCALQGMFFILMYFSACHHHSSLDTH